MLGNVDGVFQGRSRPGGYLLTWAVWLGIRVKAYHILNLGLVNNLQVREAGASVILSA